MMHVLELHCVAMLSKSEELGFPTTNDAKVKDVSRIVFVCAAASVTP